MQEKKCCKCQLTKPISEYYKDKSRPDGYHRRCRDCQRLHVRESRERNPQTYKRKDQSYYARNREQIIRKRLEHYRRNRKKYLAYQKVKTALYKGIIERQPCEECNDPKSMAHHDDYNKPLEVRWLCSTHHQRWHAENTPTM